MMMTTVGKSRSHPAQSAQKEALLKLFEHCNYAEIGRQWCNKIIISKTKGEIDAFWQKASHMLNAKGPAKSPEGWKKSWWDHCRYNVQKAHKNHEVKQLPQDGSDDELAVLYTTGNSETDRVMKIVGWEVVFSSEFFPSIDDKENDLFDDMTNGEERQRSRSPLSAWKGRNTPSPSPPPQFSVGMKRSLSPLSRATSPGPGSSMQFAGHKKRSLSPLSRATSPGPGSSMQFAGHKKRSLSPLSRASSPGPSLTTTLTELSTSVGKIAEALERNTAVLEQLKQNFESATVTVLDQSQLINVETITQEAEEVTQQNSLMEVSDEPSDDASGSDSVFMGRGESQEDMSDNFADYLNNFQ